ncbi:MAG: ATP:cob(I)alamin adenosyltransferase [Spirochaetota bacterium]
MAGELHFDQVTTRGGDTGDSSLFDGERRSKADPVFEALGDLDELGSWIGVLRARHRNAWEGPLRDFDAELYEVQTVLQRVSALVACSPGTPAYARLEPLDGESVAALELREARLLRVTRIEPVFVVPGADPVSAELDYARTLCRRGERRVVAVIRDPARPRPDLHAAQHYVNRLSDYLFIAARTAEQLAEA